jgi:hypothetical protein
MPDVAITIRIGSLVHIWQIYTRFGAPASTVRFALISDLQPRSSELFREMAGGWRSVGADSQMNQMTTRTFSVPKPAPRTSIMRSNVCQRGERSIN